MAEDALPLARMPDADLPGAAVRVRANNADITTQVEDAVHDACLLAKRGSAIRRVLLDDAAEILIEEREKAAVDLLAPVS